jgi:hypothetical protein
MVCFLKRQIGRLAWVMLAAYLLAASPALAEEGVVLQYHHSPGDKAVYELSVSTTARVQEEGGESAKADVDVTLRCRAEYLGDTASGDWGILGTITSGAMTAKVDGEEESAELGDISARYIVSPRGEVTSYRLIRGEAPSPVYGGEGVMLEPADVFLLSGVAIFPDRPLQRGDKWQGVAKVPLLEGGGVHEQPYESVFLGPAEYCGSQCWKIKTTAQAEVEETIPSPDGLGNIEAALELSVEATWLYDPERGVIVSVDETDNIAMTVTLMAGGQKMGRATVTAVAKYRSRLTEFNGVKIAPE